jgi:ankyrin repeat protein
LPKRNRLIVNYCEEFFYSMRMGRLAAVRKLLDENPELANMKEAKSTTPLHVAARTGDLDLASLLIDRGAHLEAQNAATGSTPLKHAVFFANIDMVKLLLQRGADIENPGGTSRTPLQLALDATNERFRGMGTPGSDLDYARIANILRSRSLRQ